MKELEKTFVSGEGGFSSAPLTYTQLARTATTAIYLRSRDGHEKDFEVFKIKVRPAGTKIFNLTTTEDEEKYPATSQFGRIAWSFNNRGAAMARYELLNKGKLPPECEGSEDEDETPSTTTTVSVPVAKVTAGELKLPKGKFTHTQLAEFNGKTNQQVYNLLQQMVKDGKIKLVGTQAPVSGKGKASKLFEKA